MENKTNKTNKTKKLQDNKWYKIFNKFKKKSYLEIDLKTRLLDNSNAVHKDN